MEKSEVSEIIEKLTGENGIFEIEKIEEQDWGWKVDFCAEEVNITAEEIFEETEKTQYVDLGVDDDFSSQGCVYVKIDTSLDLDEIDENKKIVLYGAFTHSCGEYNDEDYNGYISGCLYFPKDINDTREAHLQAVAHHQENLLHGVVNHIRMASNIMDQMVPGGAKDLFKAKEMLDFLRNVSAKG
jgi:hypothetical protein